MRDLTGADLVAFFRWIKKHGPPENLEDQSRLISRALCDLGVMESMSRKAAEGLKLGLSSGDVLVSLMTAAFQMGREIEAFFGQTTPRHCAERSTQKQRSSQ